jgi:hypothetical protein
MSRRTTAGLALSELGVGSIVPDPVDPSPALTH